MIFSGCKFLQEFVGPWWKFDTSCVTYWCSVSFRLANLWLTNSEIDFSKQIYISSKQDTSKLLAKHKNVELFEFFNVCLPFTVICLPKLIPCAVRKGITCLDKGIPFAAQPPGTTSIVIKGIIWQAVSPRIVYSNVLPSCTYGVLISIKRVCGCEINGAFY